MEITNYKLSEFLKQDRELIEEYVTALSYLKPITTKRKVFHMKFKHVEFIKRNLYENNDNNLIKIMKKVQKCTDKEILDLKILEFFGLLNSIKEQIEQITHAEQVSIVPVVNVKWEIVEGSKRLQKFGVLNVLDRLTNKQPHLYKKYENMKYSLIFALLTKWNLEERLAKEMEGIKNI